MMWYTFFWSKVVSEAMKEEAKGRFQSGDYMGAAKVRRSILLLLLLTLLLHATRQ